MFLVSSWGHVLVMSFPFQSCSVSLLLTISSPGHRDLTPASGLCKTYTYSTFKPNQNVCSTHPTPCCLCPMQLHVWFPLSWMSLPPPFTFLHLHIQILPAPKACSDNVSQIRPPQILFLHLHSIPQAIFSKNTICGFASAYWWKFKHRLQLGKHSSSKHINLSHHPYFSHSLLQYKNSL